MLISLEGAKTKHQSFLIFSFDDLYQMVLLESCDSTRDSPLSTGSTHADTYSR